MNDTYKRISKTEVDIISTDDMKLYLRVDNNDDDSLIDALISVAVNTAEKQMGCDLLNTTYENCRDSIEQDLTLRRGPYYSLTSIEYMVDGSYVTLASSEYDLAEGGVFCRFYGIDLADADHDVHPEAIKITFVAGYGTTAFDIPKDIINAIKAHVDYLYENRGDCVDPKDFDKMILPITCMLVYKNNRIINIGSHY